MRSDPRCPSCDGKVSATATWCMHCGRDFEDPVDANAAGGGTVTTTREATGGFGETGSAGGDGGWADDDAVSAESGTVSYGADGAPPDPESGAGVASQVTDAVPGGSGATSRRSSGEMSSVLGALLAVAGTARDYASVSEANRQKLVVVVTVAVLLLTTLTVGSPVTPFVGAGVLGVYLYTRSRPTETVAAAASGTGYVLVALQFFEVARAATAGVLPAVGALVGASIWVVLGVVLVVSGRRIREGL